MGGKSGEEKSETWMTGLPACFGHELFDDLFKLGQP